MFEIIGNLLKTLTIFAAGFITTLYGAFVARTLWGWYLTPLGYAVPSYHTTIGVFGLLSMAILPATALLSQKLRTVEDSFGFLIGFMVISHTVTLLLGYIWHLILV